MTTTDISPSAQHQPVPSSQNFTLVGITYGLYAFGLFLIWPTLVGVVIAYVKRDDVAPLLSSHYRWLIKTFWWWLLAWTFIIGALMIVLVPHALEIHDTMKSGAVILPWEFMGAGIFGGLGILIVWLWVVYRLIRGAVRLSDGLAAP
jgi:uncharacterized membrane protein